jgi:iron(III) transport system ATP-binding protein
MAELRCEGLAKSFGETTVLSDVDLVVPEGTLTAILGASGSGKTTLLRLLIGFVAADHGVVSIGGNVVAEAGRLHVRPDRRAVGYVAQEGALFPHLTVAENVGFGLPRSERKRGARIDEALDLVGLDHRYADRQPQHLSGGEQRRVALARALAPRPAVVLLDEPFSGLDASLRAETRAAVLAAMAGVGATGVLVTHDQAEALSMGREVGVLRAGRLVQTATPAVLYQTPADLDVARFVGDAVVVAGDARAGTVVCGLGTLPVRGPAIDGPVQVMIRPEQIRVSARGGQERDAAGVAARIVGRTFFGADTVLRLELADGSGTPVTARSHAHAVDDLGDEVALAVEGPVTVYGQPPGATA